MEINFKGRLVCGTDFIFWTVLLNTGLSEMTAVACPVPCRCSLAGSCTGTFVNCYDKGLKHVPVDIPNNTCFLELRRNQITRIDNNTFELLPHLKTLYLNDNLLTRIDNNTFAGLSSLESLELRRNQITRIDNNTFELLPHLKTLYLNDNLFTRVDNNTFAGLSRLESLFLHNNMITSIESITFEKLPKLRELYVGGNPFQCTCDLGRFVMFLQRKEILPYNKNNFDEPKCSSPVHFNGKEIIEVPYHNMSCNSISEPAVILPKIKDNAPIQQIIKSTLMIGDKHITGGKGQIAPQPDECLSIEMLHVFR